MVNICVVGGGNEGHAIAAALGTLEDVKLTVLTRSPEQWSSRLVYEEHESGKCVDEGIAYVSVLHYDDQSAVEALHESDIVFVTVPGYAMKICLELITPHLSSKTWIGAVPGTHGFQWLMKSVAPNHVHYFAFQRVPFVCRIKTYGESVTVLSRKSSCFVAISNSSTINASSLITKLETLFRMRIKILTNFLEIFLSPTNPILHSGRLYSLFCSYEHGIHFWKCNPLFYGDWDDIASEMVIGLDDDLRRIRLAIPFDTSNVLSILEHYDCWDVQSFTKKMQCIPSLQQLHSPLVEYHDNLNMDDKECLFVPDFQSRYWIEEILAIRCYKNIADMYNVCTPYMDKFLDWIKRFKQLLPDKVFEENQMELCFGICSEHDFVSMT